MSEDEDDYGVGRGRPPQHSRFKTGQSGNPGGRPKGSKSWKSVIEAELSGGVSLKEQGVELKVTKMEAFAKRLVADALAGSPRALGELLRQINLHLGEASTASSRDLPATEDDVRLLLKYAEKALQPHSAKERDDD
ncbi:hypothetical protein EF888_16755 [Silicimonas algicola]|uniref:DUF5681 domain-containing protein n=1 Tax=Silicimonas algicola TaxID=1826607 RepID=A0A316G419_9RHOB|nr:DUF5681 domain-containing protein [Silicimonas algicola]AZQ68636.1 hypothetical protein EF888_16755 [Silicimonas algicola]PWK55639.1 hypothetical protein C8D95_10634 [Silicimonas algicola]